MSALLYKYYKTSRSSLSFQLADLLPLFIIILHTSTYDTLPSPSNLKRWELPTEAPFYLCNKDTSTTSHILGVCKVALSQGRFTFRHDNVLRVIISNIKSSVKNIKSSVPTSKQPIKIKFVEKGTRVKNKNWVLLGDQMALFPFHLT